MIHTARIGYSPSPPALATPDFQVDAPDGPSSSMRIAWAYCRPSSPDRPNLLREALEEEGLADKVDWARVRKVAGVLEDVVDVYPDAEKDGIGSGRRERSHSQDGRGLMERMSIDLYSNGRAPRIRSKL